MDTVLILGATSDIGIAIAKKFASQHYNIQLAARNTELLAPLKADIIIRNQVNCTLHTFDAVNYNSHTSFFESLNPKPAVTISIFGVMDEEEDAFNDWELTQRMINTNYTGVVSILNISAKYYIAQQKGDIIAISSVAGDRGRASKLIYGSSKAALSAYLSGLRNKCFKEKVHVMTVKPGFVYTRMTENLPLPKPLTSTPSHVADIVYSGFVKKKNIVYVKWMWRYIMLIIKNIPEFQFKKMKL
jgi:decaprenylphospho-beta-D-erythro-pentofuranosid-2-ulose 2-reductase